MPSNCPQKEFLAGNSPFLDSLLKDKDKYALRSSQTLACEDCLKHLGYESAIKEGGWFYEKYKPYTFALGLLHNIANFYCSGKYGFEPMTGADAAFSDTGAMFTDDMKRSFVSGSYKMAYDAYMKSKESQKKEV